VDARFTTAVLVEGISDRGAIEALAERRGYDLEAAGVSVVSIGGSKNVIRWLEAFGPRGLDVRLAGLCDAAQEDDFRRGLERAGLGSALTREDMERLGFFVCVEDLEDELIRSLGVAAVEAVIEEQGELGSFRTFQRQVEWRDRSVDQQLRRFLGTTRGRKIRSAPALVEALDMAEVPRPLARLLDHVRGIDG
jgi:predicted ATP-dependent endonuclease of OLD family